MVENYVCPVLLCLILGIVGANRMPPAAGCRVSVEVGGVYLDWGTLGAASSDMLLLTSVTGRPCIFSSPSWACIKAVLITTQSMPQYHPLSVFASLYQNFCKLNFNA